MTNFAQIPVDRITAHPNNPRRDATASEELVDSIKANGIVQALTVVDSPDGEGYLLLAGHRRLDGARQAGLTQVPAMIRTDLVTTEQHIEAMAIENIQRVDLTPIEEAEAYEQLTLVGYKPKDIAKATGRSVSTVTGRLKLTTLAPAAKDAIQSHDMTLEDALALVELEEFPTLLAKVEKTIGTNNFDGELRMARNRLEKERGYQAKRTEFLAQGLHVIDKPEQWDYQHGPKPFYGAASDTDGEISAWYEDEWSGPTLVITNVGSGDESADAAARAAATEQRQSEWEAAQAERAAEHEAQEAARGIRLDVIGKFLEGLKVPKELTGLLRVVMPSVILASNDLLRRLDEFTPVALDPDKPFYQQDLGRIAADLQVMKDKDLIRATFTGLALLMDSELHDPFNPADALRKLDYMDWLAAAGHTESDTDLALRDSLTASATQSDEDEDA